MSQLCWILKRRVAIVPLLPRSDGKHVLFSIQKNLIVVVKRWKGRVGNGLGLILSHCYCITCCLASVDLSCPVYGLVFELVAAS